MSGKSKKVEDMNYFELIAWLGIGSSHPGGFPATQQNLAAMQIETQQYVLDAGCGSGLTACHLAKTAGCKIIGIDISAEMVEKASLRAEKEGVSHLVEFRVADVYHLPFDDNHFDFVMAESITVFLDKVKVYQEFYRVLKPEGRVADLEMVILAELPANIRSEMEACFGSATNPLPYEEYLEALTQAGFLEVELKNPQRMKSNGNVILTELKKDWVLVKGLAEKAAHLPSLMTRLRKNSNFMKKNRGYFGFGLICGRKPTPPTPPEKVGFKDWMRKLLDRSKSIRDRTSFYRP